MKEIGEDIGKLFWTLGNKSLETREFTIFDIMSRIKIILSVYDMDSMYVEPYAVVPML